VKHSIIIFCLMYFIEPGLPKAGIPISHPDENDTLLEFGDCHITTLKTACPSDSGNFSYQAGGERGKYFTRISFAVPVTTGYVKNPEFESVPETWDKNLEWESGSSLLSFKSNRSGAQTYAFGTVRPSTLRRVICDRHLEFQTAPSGRFTWRNLNGRYQATHRTE
jgi:hypothetical protein